MKPSHRFSSSTSIRLIALALCYALIVTTAFLPLSPSVIARAKGSSGSLSKKLTTRATPNQQMAARREGELLIRFRAGVSEQNKDTLRTSHGARRKKQLRGESTVEKLEVLGGQNVETVALQLSLNPEVEFAEPNFLISKDDLGTSDPRFDEQWALHNTGQNGGQFGSDINATTAWQTTTGSQSAVIAVIDSGIDLTHPDLTNNRWENPAPGPAGDLNGWDYITDSGVVRDEQGHGTAIAGIIAAEGNNETGISGVMWHASLMSLRVLDNTGSGDVANAVEAIDYAVQHGAEAINLSWGTSGYSLALKDAIERAMRRGVVVVCSAGNNGQDVDATPYYPASFGSRDLIAVASTDNFDQLSSWSNRGRRRVTVAAPGTGILTTQMGGGYWMVTGTSASAPLVTGVAGLMKSYRRGAGAADIRAAIANGARQVAALTGQVSSGGVVDAGRALEALQINPYRGNGNGGGNNGNGQGSGGSNVPAGQRQDTSGRRANGREGLRVPKPAEVQGAPGANLPNLDQLRSEQPAQPKAKTPIQSNLMCGDCGGGGGGGGYYPPGDPRFSTARTLPRNETGQTNVDLGSRNFNWSLPLVSLPGRTGLDLSFTLSYNSLVWTKDGSYIKFNADLGTPAPGFRLGLPTLQQRFYNSQTGVYAYMMVTASGGRVEMRQIGSTSVYESADGSYTQLTDYTTSAVVKTSDGTQLTFVPTNDAATLGYRCTQIKDRNGNYISASYNLTNGHLLTATDTLGRVISFIYNTDSNLQAIRQTWAGVAHDWATFSYGQVWVAPSFGGGLLVNGPNNAYATILTQVSLHDGSYFTFAYNAAFGQVNRINHYAPDTHLLAYTSYNVDSSTGQTDCPRFTQRKDWAENWNSGAEGVTSYSVDPGSSWSQQTAPDGTIYKELYATSGWQSGLTTNTEIWAGGVKKKWTSMVWTHDNGSGYQKNPRVIEVNTYDDAANRRRTTIDYTSYSLPNIVREWTGAGGTVLYRTTTTAYKLDTEYVNRRIIGLVDNVQITDGATGALVSKTSYAYDWDFSGDCFQDTPAPAVQHDRTNYGPSLISGRGNMSYMARYDVNDPQNLNDTVVTTVWRVNSTGSVLMIRDHLWHPTYISYNDSFSDGVNRNTFAYPTTVTDAEGFQSLTKYNFDYGAVTWKQTPSPNSGQTAPTASFTYDSATRLQQITNGVNYAYTRWVYPTSQTAVQTFSTIVSGAGEAYAVQVFDGAGRVRATASDHPGSAGLYSGQYIIYDNMGRVAQQSNPTEMNWAWAASGDDPLWRYTVQAYDWKGRPNQITNTDGTARTFSYGGCGCAGGEVTTAQDEHGRQRRLTKDTLGRLAKVEELNWGGSVYATTNYAYNARDQITQSNQAGQLRSFGYDGHGRLQTRTTPEQGTMTYSYNRDDTVNVVTDARAATTTFGYNARHLVTGITYGVPSGVAATNQVGFAYDAAGNRTNMTTWYVGTVNYQYDQLSRMTSETRSFDYVGNFTLSYQYNLAGELTSVTNPWNAQVGYSYDKVGRPIGVTGSGYSGVSNYASALTYRAFGGLKGMGYGNGRTLATAYDNRLRPTTWNVAGVLGYNYTYQGDYMDERTGRVTYAQNIQDPTLDRSYEYDQLGRLAISHSGAEARAHALWGPWNIMDGPYSQGYDYDVWGNVTHKYGWGGEVQGGSPSASTDITYSYTGNRRNGFSYDAAGNLTNDLGQTFTYDAAGQQATASYGGYLLQQVYDGDGLRVKKVENGTPTLYLRSTALGGQIVAELNGSGGWMKGYVYLGSQLLAVQRDNSVSWIHEDPITKSKRVTNSAGTVVSTIEMDPWGADTNRSSNAAFQPRKYTSYDRDNNGTDEAMFRRYNRWQSRFDQPDPYDGSYNPSNPQSFNRYAYVQGDPVNFVDPTGLRWQIAETCVTIDGDRSCSVVGIYWIPDPEPFSYSGYYDGRDRPRGGGGPQNPGRDEKEINDCKTLAAMVQNIADLSNTATDFLDRMATTFTAAAIQDSSISEMNRTQNMRSRINFGDSGFKPQFQDGGNQVRHFVAGFIAGVKAAPFEWYARQRMNERENPNNPLDRADINLNNISTTLGGAFGGNLEDARKYLARAIRASVCQ